MVAPAADNGYSVCTATDGHRLHAAEKSYRDPKYVGAMVLDTPMRAFPLFGSWWNGWHLTHDATEQLDCTGNEGVTTIEYCTDAAPSD